MNKEILALNVKGEFYRLYHYCRCSECRVETDNNKIKLAFREEGANRDKWFCPECYEKFKQQLLEFVEGRSESVEMLLFDEEEGGSYTMSYLSKEEESRMLLELYEIHGV